MSKAFKSRSLWLLEPRPHPRHLVRKQLTHDTEFWSLLLASPPLILESIAALVGGFWLHIYLIERFQANLEANVEKYNKQAERFEKFGRWLDHVGWMIPILCLPAIWLEVAYILRLRDTIRSISGPAWIENEMGFGQILGLLIWMPVVVQFILTLSEPLLTLYPLRDLLLTKQI